MSTSKSETESTAEQDSNNSLISFNPKALAGVFKEVGMAGFIVIMLIAMFILFSTSQQKQKFIDRFILFEPDSTTPFSVGYVVVVLVTYIIIQHHFHKKTVKALKEEVDRLSQIKSFFQSEVTGKKLRSSR